MSNNKYIEIWLVRHGLSEINDKRQNKVYQGVNTWSELTEKAKIEAVKKGREWKEKKILIDLWLCSPSVRTQQTCRYWQEGMGIEWPTYELAFDLIELGQGAAEGKNRDLFEVKGDDDAEPNESYWNKRLYYYNTNLLVHGAETQKEVFLRVKSCIEEKCLKTLGYKGRISVFTHENVIKCLMVGLGVYKAAEYKSFSVGNLEIVKFCLRDEQWCLID